MDKRDIYAIARRSEQTAFELQKEADAYLKQHPTVSEDTVFDENMSVKWNREEARLRNQLNAHRLAGMYEKIGALKESLDDTLKAYLMPQYQLGEGEVAVALRHAKECSSPLTSEYVDMAERFCTVLDDVRHVGE